MVVVGQRPIDEGLKESGLSNDKARSEVTRNIHNLVRRIKKEEFGNFSYMCMRSGFICDGRKEIIKHLEEEYKSELQKSQDLCDKKEDFKFVLTKLVMSAPFIKHPQQEKESTPTPKTKATAPASTPLGQKDDNTPAAKEAESEKPVKKRKPIVFNESEAVPAQKKKTNTGKAAPKTEIKKSAVPDIKFSHEERYKEQKEREEGILAAFTQQQLKKLLVSYIQTLSSTASLKTFSIQEVIKTSGVKVTESKLLDLLLFLHEFSSGFYHEKNNTPVSENRLIKIGKIPVTSGQRKMIRDNGLRSLRCLEKLNAGWQHPDSWRILLPPGSTLGPKWGKKEDSHIIVGAYKHNMDINKIASDVSLGFKSVAFDKEELTQEFKDRYGYMLNLYISRGKFNDEMAYKIADLKLILSKEQAEDSSANPPAEEDKIEMVSIDDDDNEVEKGSDAQSESPTKTIEEKDSLDDLIEEMKAEKAAQGDVSLESEDIEKDDEVETTEKGNEASSEKNMEEVATEDKVTKPSVEAENVEKEGDSCADAEASENGAKTEDENAESGAKIENGTTATPSRRGGRGRGRGRGRGDGATPAAAK